MEAEERCSLRDELLGYLLAAMCLLWLGGSHPERLLFSRAALLVGSHSQILVQMAALVWELSLKPHRGKLPELEGSID